MSEAEANLWLLEQVNGAAKPLSSKVPWAPMSVAEMRERLKRGDMPDAKEVSKPRAVYSKRAPSGE